MELLKNCQNCGQLIAAGDPQGLCPACLMKIGLGIGTGTGTANENAGSGSAADFVPPSLEQLQRSLPQFEVLGMIGRGGMGAVFKVRQKSLDRLVALKILAKRSNQDPKFNERFALEARTLARLSHPNIISVFDFGEVEGLCYLVMEYVDGVNLRQMLQFQKMAPKEALVIVPDLCAALQYAHDQGVVHRDIKPENILIDRQGRVKIADFGLAKLLGTETGGVSRSRFAACSPPTAGDSFAMTRQNDTLTVAGKIMGTPNYMAPEQIEHPQAVDHRADIYSLGVVFYEMLTGELPIGTFAPPSLRVQIDVRLDEVVLRTLETAPERRYQQASQVQTALETIAKQTPSTPTDSATSGSSMHPSEIESKGPWTSSEFRELSPEVHGLKPRLRLVSITLVFLGLVVLYAILGVVQPIGNEWNWRSFVASLALVALVAALTDWLANRSLRRASSNLLRVILHGRKWTCLGAVILAFAGLGIHWLFVQHKFLWAGPWQKDSGEVLQFLIHHTHAQTPSGSQDRAFKARLGAPINAANAAFGDLSKHPITNTAPSTEVSLERRDLLKAHSWDITYNLTTNISSMADRWRLIQYGIEQLRDEGLRQFPGDPQIYLQLAWYFMHLMSPKHSSMYRPDDPTLELSSTGQRNVVNPTQYYQQQWVRQMNALLGTGRPDFNEWIQPSTVEARTRTENLQTSFKLDPAFMKDVDERYGPLDWRLPATHAIYWAAHGIQHAHILPGKVTPDELAPLHRVILHSMGMSFEQGRLLSSPDGPDMELGHNFDIIRHLNAVFESRIKEEEGNLVEHTTRSHRNFLRDAVYALYRASLKTEAVEWFDVLKTTYSQDPLIYGQPETRPAKLSCEEYVRARQQIQKSYPR
jgi:serine/threonine protein kinase